MDRDFAAVNQLASNPGVIGRQWAGCYASGRDCGAPPQLGIYNSQGESDSVLGYLLTYGGAVVGGVFGAWAGEKANDLVWNFTYEQVRG